MGTVPTRAVIYNDKPKNCGCYQPGRLAVADASELLQLLEDLVLAAVGRGGVKGELLQVVGDAARKCYLVSRNE